MPETRGALADLRVLELGEFVSAPWCGKVFSGMGAEVIKVEPPGRGDKARRAGPFPGDVPHPEKSGLFMYHNTDKLGITLDVTQPTGRRLFLELVLQADLVLDNHLPQELTAWGLDYPHLQEVNPRVILTSITPFGWEGPWSGYKGDDLVTFETSGTGYETPRNAVTDPDNQRPLKGAEYQADMGAGWTAASAAMVAVRNQWRSGEGQFVDVSIQEALANMVRPNISWWSYEQYAFNDRLKTGLAWALPCKDGYVSMMTLRDAHWPKMLQLMGNPEWAQSEVFTTQESRQENWDVMETMMEEFLMSHTKAELFDMIQGEHMNCFPYNDAAEVLDSEHYRHRAFWVEVKHPLTGAYQYPGAAGRFSTTPMQTLRPAPLLGQHNEEVFCQRLGHSQQELRDLRFAGVI